MNTVSLYMFRKTSTSRWKCRKANKILDNISTLKAFSHIKKTQTNNFPPKFSAVIYLTNVSWYFAPLEYWLDWNLRHIKFSSPREAINYDNFHASEIAFMTTFLRMQPTCGKKKKFWAWKFNIFLVYGKCEREFSPKKFRSLQNIRTFEGEKERENVTGALIIRNINHRRYTIKGMILASCMLLHFGFTKTFPTSLLWRPFLAFLSRRHTVSTEAFAHVNVLYALLHVRFPRLFMLFFSLADLMLHRTPLFIPPCSVPHKQHEMCTTR